MAYEPTLPLNNSPIVASELRGQFAGLKEILDVKRDAAQVEAETSGAVLPVAYLGLTVSNPPTQAEMQAIADKLDELMVYLKRE